MIEYKNSNARSISLMFIVVALLVYPNHNAFATQFVVCDTRVSLHNETNIVPNNVTNNFIFDDCSRGRHYFKRELAHKKQIHTSYSRNDKNENALNISNRNTGLNCNVNAYCASVNKTYELMSAQIGLNYQDQIFGMIFIPMHSNKAELMATEGKPQYASDLWINDKKFFYIKVSDNGFLPLQVDFNGDNIENCNNCKAFLIVNIFYRQSGVDYSDYEDKASRSQLEILVDANSQVIDHNLIVYDNDDNLVEARKLAIGDQIQLLYTGDKYQDTEHDYLYLLEDFMTVTHPPEFNYAFAIPGEDFTCTHCARDFSNMDLYFRLQGFNYDEQGQENEIIRTDLQYLGKTNTVKQSSAENKTQVNPTVQTIDDGFNAAHVVSKVNKQDNVELTGNLFIPPEHKGKEVIYLGSALYQGRYYKLLTEKLTLDEIVSRRLFEGSVSHFNGNIDIYQEYILLDDPTQRYGNAFRIEMID